MKIVYWLSSDLRRVLVHVFSYGFALFLLVIPSMETLVKDPLQDQC